MGQEEDQPGGSSLGEGEDGEEEEEVREEGEGEEKPQDWEMAAVK